MKDRSSHLPSSSLSRRQLIALAGAQAAALLLEGCGGGSGGGDGSGGAGSRTIPVQVLPPKGAVPANLELVSGFGSQTGLNGRVYATVFNNWVSSVLVRERGTGKLVMIGMVDPTASTNVLDAANVAATLLFLSVGGSQLFGALRNPLWKTLLADPATATLAAVVRARLDANPLALENGDAQIKAALAQALPVLSAATLAVADPRPPLNRSRSGAGRSAPAARPRGRAALPPPPSPAVTTTAHQPLATDPGFLLDNPVDGSDTFYDYIVLTKLTVQETAFYVLGSSRDTGKTVIQDNPFKKLLGPISLDWAQENDTALVSDPLTFPLADPADVSRRVYLVYLAPIFGSPEYFDINFLGRDNLTEWNPLLAGMFQRAVVMIANTLFLEALGLGGLTFTLDQVKAETDALNALGGDIAAALTMAAQGKDLIGSLNALIAACTADAGTATKLYTILAPIRATPAGTFESANAPERLRQTVRLSKVLDFFGAADAGNRFRGAMINACEFHDPISVYLARYSILDASILSTAVKYSLSPDTGNYTPGGAPIQIRAASKPAADNSRRKYHWKLITSGSATLSDGAGNTGLEFDSAKSVVTFQAGAGANGDQTVQVTVYNTESGAPVLAGSASVILTRNNVPPPSLLPRLTSLRNGETQTFTAVVDDAVKNSGTLSYRWATSGQFGQLTQPVGAGETASATAVYRCTSSATGTDTVSVEVFTTVNGVKQSLGSAQAQVKVEAKKSIFFGRYETKVLDSYPGRPPIESYVNVAGWVIIPQVEGATSYTVYGYNFYDPAAYGHEATWPMNWIPRFGQGGDIWYGISGGDVGKNDPHLSDSVAALDARFKGMIVEVHVTY